LRRGIPEPAQHFRANRLLRSLGCTAHSKRRISGASVLHASGTGNLPRAIAFRTRVYRWLLADGFLLKLAQARDQQQNFKHQ
jgi:hypothetical protein